MEDDSDFSDEETWNEDDTIEVQTRCLFCDHVAVSVESAMSHCNAVHKFSFAELMKKFHMDCYSFIKFVNFIRKTSISAEKILNLESSLWNDDEFLKPVEEFDPWLMFDFEEYFSSIGDGLISDPTGKPQEEAVHLQAQLQQKDEQIAQLNYQLTQMKNFVHKILQDDVDSTENTTNWGTKSDSSYFESYSHPGIHYDMLADEVRTLGYKNPIMNNRPLFDGRTVLDLGCGTGILSMFAASAGAKEIIAVDNSDIVYFTMDIVRENNMEDRIQIVKSRVEDNPFPDKQVDIIISEWMGYFLLFEGMLDSLIYARDHYLKPGGVIMPDQCQLFIHGANDLEAWKSHHEFWSDVYGYRMSCIKKEVVKQAVVDVIPKEKIVTTPALLSSFNLYECSIEDTNFTSSFELTANMDTTITTLVGYFDVTFNLEQKSSFSTSPLGHTTHWKQTLFHISEPISLKEGEKLTGKLSCHRNCKNSRSLLISIFVNEKRYDYDLD